MSQPGFPEGTPSKLIVWQEMRHRQGRTAVRRVASRRHAARLVMDTLQGFSRVHPAVDQAEHRRRRRSRVERSVSPPRQVAGKDVFGIESPSLREALGEANRHADGTAVAVTRRQSQEGTPDAIF